MSLSSASRDASRQELDEQIQQFDSDRSLRTRRNALATINILPNELIVYVFLTWRDLQRAYPSKSYKPHLHEGYDFKNISGVCSLWRDITVQYPSLWSDVNVKSPRWTELQLNRSQKAILTLRCESPPHFEQFISAFSENIDRVSHCKVTFDYPETLAEDFLPLLDTAPPVLEAVKLVASETLEAEEFLKFNPHVPHLRRLELSKFVLLWTTACFTSLTHLSITAGRFKPTLNQMMDMLRCTAALQSLKLFGAIPICKPERRPECRAVVQLDQLAHLELRASKISSALHFTKHLKFSKTTCDHIGVSGKLFGIIHDDLRSLVQSLYSHDLLENHSCLVVDIADSEEVILQTIDFSFSRRVRRVRIIYGDIPSPGPRFIGKSFSTFKRFTCLEILLDRDDFFPSKAWAQSLQEMSQVTELRLKNFNPMALQCLFEDLGVGPDFLLPGLRKLDIQAVEGGMVNSLDFPWAIAPLLETLRNRKLNGFGIQHLSVTDNKGVPLDGVRQIFDDIQRGRAGTARLNRILQEP